MSELEAVIIRHYQIHRHLAKGGMSQIYLARDLVTEQMVAIKLVHCENHDHCERFRREIAAISRLQHEHILPALAHGECGNWYYLVTPYIEYGTLARRLGDGPMTLEEAGSIFSQLARALHYAHEHGVLHRDIKPANILLDAGQHVYLTDFGLAQQVGVSNGITRTDILIGTPDYMAPELAEHAATTSSDIYALGVLLYQMLTGSVPFNASTPVSTFLKHIYEQATPPSHINPTIPYSVEQVILRALAKEPQARFATANDLAQAYQQALIAKTTKPLPVEIKIVPTRPKLTPIRREQKVAVSLLATLLFCIMPLFMGFSFSYFQGRLPQTSILGASIAGKITHVPTISHPYHIQPQGPGTASNQNQAASQPPPSFDLSENMQDTDNNKHNQNNGKENDKGDGKGHGKKGHGNNSIIVVTNSGYSPLEGFDA
ncbi:MAG TPA: serine/threonine-protein kinase [Ktedonosporobacter sp.]|nr:serine/threonine-protein kinase [Ktedonosporobacter sp.]